MGLWDSSSKTSPPTQGLCFRCLSLFERGLSFACPLPMLIYFQKCTLPFDYLEVRVFPSQVYLWRDNWNSDVAIFQVFKLTSSTVLRIILSVNIYYHISVTRKPYLQPRANVYARRFIHTQPQSCAGWYRDKSDVLLQHPYTKVKRSKSPIRSLVRLLRLRCIQRWSCQLSVGSVPGRQAVKGWRKADKGWTWPTGLSSVYILPPPTQSPSQVEQSTEHTNVIYARSRPLKDAFPQRGVQIGDGNVTQSCAFLYVLFLGQRSSLSSQWSPNSGRRVQDTGKQCEGEESSVRINREESREGTRFEGEMRKRQAAGFAGYGTPRRDAPLCVG